MTTHAHDAGHVHVHLSVCVCVCVCVCARARAPVYVSSSAMCSLKRKLRVGRGWDKPEATRLGSDFGAGASLR